MGKFDTYKIDLKSLSIGVHEYEYALDNKFFVDIDGTEVQKGKVKVFLTVKHSHLMSEMSFRIEGSVYIPCDRCLDDMELSIETQNRLVVKFGKEYAEESDEIVVIPEAESGINLAWFLYEFVALAVPMKHIHPPGKCNKTMTTKIKKHSPKNVSDEESGHDDESDDMMEDDDVAAAPDPRWDTLKGYMDSENDNN